MIKKKTNLPSVKIPFENQHRFLPFNGTAVTDKKFSLFICMFR